MLANPKLWKWEKLRLSNLKVYSVVLQPPDPLSEKRPFSVSETAFRLKRKGHVLGTCHLFPRWECFIPSLGVFCSQGGIATPHSDRGQRMLTRNK